MERILFLIGKLLCLVFLTVASFLDVKEKALPLLLIGAAAASGILLQALGGLLPYYEVLGGCLVGVVVLLLAFLTRQRIGYGDGLVLVVTGAFLGVCANMVLLFAAFFLSAMISLLLMVFKGKNGGFRMAFLPFILAGYDLALLWF